MQQRNHTRPHQQPSLMAGREGFACPNPSCKCKACTCGDGCTCGVSAEVTCDPCKDFKALVHATQLAVAARNPA